MGAVILGYGVVAYLLFLAAFVYLVLFIGGETTAIVEIPKTLDWGGSWASGAPPALLNVALLTLFGLQHSLMARSGFKRALTRVVPEAAERSTFVLATVVCLVLLYGCWIPMPAIVWSVASPLAAGLLRALFFAGAAIVGVSAFLIDHLELFGLRQTWAGYQGRPLPAPEFRTPWLYRLVRHPLYFGMLFVFWSTPIMTVGHLLFAAVWTAYLLVGIRYEERDLIRVFGDRYRAYADATPMILPVGRYRGR